MSSLQRLRELRGHALDFLRIRLSAHDEVTIMAALGLVSGLLAGVVILAFRFLVESTQSHILPDGSTENFEALEPVFRLLLCIAGGLTTGLLFQTVSDRLRNVGIVHVMERLASYQGHLPLGNALMQFLGGAISIISGHSVGREGPGIHLGAAAGSQLGVRLGLPNNTVRTLTACGVAASIAASFNTPLAGVIFAMEVVMMEYTLYGFAPVILAAVSATTVTHLVYGNEPAFSVPEIQMLSLSELPLVLLTGLAVGLVAAAFNHSVVFFSGRLVHWPPWLRMTVAGTLTGLLAMALPQIMGIGYDTVTAALLGELGLLTLIAIAAFKLLATTAGIGLGLPGGLIGPTLVVGATVGGGRRSRRIDLATHGSIPTGFLRLARYGCHDGRHTSGTSGSSHGYAGALWPSKHHHARLVGIDHGGAICPTTLSCGIRVRHADAEPRT